MANKYSVTIDVKTDMELSATDLIDYFRTLILEGDAVMPCDAERITIKSNGYENVIFG